VRVVPRARRCQNVAVPELHSLLLFLLAGLTLNVTPGPDMLYVAARGASEGRAAGVVSALGITAGAMVHLTLVALGLATLLAAVPLAYTVLRLAGAAYLVVLGVRALRATGGLALPEHAPAPLPTIFRQAVLTNVFNPKVALFFLAFLPQFVDPRRGPPALQIVILGLLFNTTSTLVNGAVALGASAASARLRRGGRAAVVLQRLTGGLFVALGLWLAYTGLRR
jgi:threonine/homoserine/homoserine lactone efflux protein